MREGGGVDWCLFLVCTHRLKLGTVMVGSIKRLGSGVGGICDKLY